MQNNTSIGTIEPTFSQLQGLTAKPSVSSPEPRSLSLDDRGMIIDCSNSSLKFFGYRRSDLVWRHVSRLFPKFSEIQLIQNGEFNPSIVYLARCGMIFHAHHMLGDLFSCNLNFVHLQNNGKHTLRMIASPEVKAGKLAHPSSGHPCYRICASTCGYATPSRCGYSVWQGAML